MSNNIRIRTSPNGNDNYIKVNIEQNFDFIEILSLSLSQQDAYRRFCSDYGVVVGRVNVNGGFGVPNAKVSIFIPIDEIDKKDPLISGLYPYQSITDKNSDGVRYNLLGLEPETNNDCFTPVGTFPTKRQVLDNEVMANIYCKYYKFTTTTNHAGDFMLFGVPIGTYTLHIDADLSDIGIISQRPYDMMNQGSSEKLFYSTTKFKGGTDLNKLIQVKSTNVGVNVQPFWGDTDNCQIGITRADVDLNYTVQPYAIFMGSIFGDQHKHSVNYRCRPRPKLGELCQQIVASGSINMIRKTPDGTIEQFDVDGGRLIDDNGTWAYLVPMNLDNLITDEYGDLVPTSDPNIGIPTRAKVRFKIAMDETGGEGRLRTRANYLVPNNPQSVQEIDYNFDETTKDVSFKDLYWNKIYTVSNFIPRYQSDTNVSPNPHSRAMTAIKNVDACAGTATPFPYNRVNTSDNPLYTIFCIFITIFAFIVNLINQMISILNAILNGLSQKCVPCITLKCHNSDGDDIYFAPGCNKKCGVQRAESIQGITVSKSPSNGSCSDKVTDSCGWEQCQSFELAKTLGLFQFDFYNDWVNGSLYSYLLKYKKKRKGRERFCEYDCSNFASDPNYSGVDGNNNGVPDNDCYNHMFLDTCYPNQGNDAQDAYYVEQPHTEGLIKKYRGEFYYASTLHLADKKLFATDIICLGSVFQCDWQSFPNLQPYLISTTYKLPPDVDEVDDNGANITSGMVSLSANQGLFFNVDCSGLHVDGNECNNIRHICEFGVDLDELTDIGNIVYQPDGTLGHNDIDETYGKEFRDSFIILNSGATTGNLFTYQNLDSDFNKQNCSDSNGYDFANIDTAFGTCGSGVNGVDYVNFRGFSSGSATSYGQPNHSFFMYFGLLPGKTALDKMNNKFFAKCIPQVLHNILIVTHIIPDSANTSNGSITFIVEGGQAPFTYNITGPNGYIQNGTTLNSETFNSLSQGSYNITVTDVLGDTITDTVIVGGIVPLSCTAYVSQNVTGINASNGKISGTVFGGVAPYTYTLVGNSNNTPSTSLPLTNNAFTLINLAGDIYTLTIKDSLNTTCTKTGLTVNTPTNLRVSADTQNPTCWNSNDGYIQLIISGGYAPYTALTYSSLNTLISSGSTAFDLSADTYTIHVNDSSGQVHNPIQAQLIANNPALHINTPSISGNTNITFKVTSTFIPTAPITVVYNNGNGPTTTTASLVSNNTYFFTPTTPVHPISFSACNDSNCVCGSETLTIP